LRSFAAKISQTVENDREIFGRFSVFVCSAPDALLNYCTATVMVCPGFPQSVR
jgi:hypothetical protein